MSNNVVVTWSGSKEDAQALVQAISPDDSESFVIDLDIMGDSATLTIKVSEESVRTLRTTIDDILACLSAAESALSEA
ncbi:KEOPS complex subunit Pcc1 [Euryarchaeota archaeon]|nr:KEOPS complex subunit Pcc1 [Euryarchaeota archaeon]|tara:strand:- start:1789 stop:2022 length:234 start_codon:yes stop_codon:yes gene_type:complete